MIDNFRNTPFSRNILLCQTHAPLPVTKKRRMLEGKRSIGPKMKYGHANHISPYYCVYTWKMMFFPSPFPLPYTKVTNTLSLTNPVDFLTACKMLWCLCVIAGTSDSKNPKLYYSDMYLVPCWSFASFNHQLFILMSVLWWHKKYVM